MLRHGSREPTVGDVFLKVVSCHPRERWPQWRIARLVANTDGTAHAIMLALSDGMTTRRIALTALTRSDQWQSMPRAEKA
jgi:hypothetical protein